jgi:hypothetical protein
MTKTILPKKKEGIQTMTKKNQAHKPANLTIKFSGGDTAEASAALTPLLTKFSKALAEIDAPLNSLERAMVGTFVLWLLAEGSLDTEQLKVTRYDENDEDRTDAGAHPDADSDWESGIT